MSKIIYIHKNGSELGPYTDKELRMHWANGLFTADDLAWEEGREEWTPLKDFFGAPQGLSNSNVELQNSPDV